jgi:hypothetical protein
MICLRLNLSTAGTKDTGLALGKVISKSESNHTISSDSPAGDSRTTDGSEGSGTESNPSDALGGVRARGGEGDDGLEIGTEDRANIDSSGTGTNGSLDSYKRGILKGGARGDGISNNRVNLKRFAKRRHVIIRY